MLTNITYKVNRIERSYTGKNLLLELGNENGSFEVEMYLINNTPSLIEIIDELVWNGSFGKGSFKEFLDRTNLNVSEDELLAMYDHCKYIHDNMTILFGSYEVKWNLEMNDNLRRII